ncbi:MAG: hypothetical protein DWQ11_06505 [Proteobacteria bacterium]|nr:MAG: hypothetical protein DWQ11_06505 [Pseudomonadota bacterium]
MKFNQLPLGARFEYQGKILTKTGPMTGATEKGGSVFIPKFAVLKPADGEAPPPPKAARTVDADAVLAAFEAYHGTAMRLVDESGRMALAAARARFLGALGEHPTGE